MNVPPVIRRRALLALLPVLACTAGCMSHFHSVGLGATGTREVSARQFYLFFGLVPLNEVDTQRMATDLTSYTVETKWGFTDLLLLPLAGLTMTTRTVVVRT